MPKFKIMQDVGPMGVFRLAEWEAESDKDALNGFLRSNPAYAGSKKGLIFAKPLDNGKGWSDEDVNEMAQKMYKQPFDDLSMDEQNKVYAAIQKYLDREKEKDMPFFSKNERRNIGQIKYGSEIKNAKDMNGDELKVGDKIRTPPR